MSNADAGASPVERRVRPLAQKLVLRVLEVLEDGPAHCHDVADELGIDMTTASATLSDLIPISSFGTPGWMDYVENLKKRQFDGIYESATRLIDNSPWEIKGLPKRPAAGAGMNLGRITSPIKELGGNIKGIFGG